MYFTLHYSSTHTTRLCTVHWNLVGFAFLMNYAIYTFICLWSSRIWWNGYQFQVKYIYLKVLFRFSFPCRIQKILIQKSMFLDILNKSIRCGKETVYLYYLNTPTILCHKSAEVKLSSYSSLCLNNKLSLNPRESLSEIEHLHALASVQHWLDGGFQVSRQPGPGGRCCCTIVYG